jgi:hypothetical protein
MMQSRSSRAILAATKGSKNKFAESFWRDLSEVSEAKGKQAFEDALAADPAKFISVAG